MDEIYEPLNENNEHSKNKQQHSYKNYSNEENHAKNKEESCLPTQEIIFDKLNNLCPNLLIAKILFGVLLMNPFTKFFIKTRSVYKVYSKTQVKSLHKILIYSLLFILFFMIVFFNLSERNVQFLYFLDIFYLLMHIYFYSQE